jgi:hypothetical protein
VASGKAMKPVISISRRTDIPAAYSDWLANALERGEVNFLSPHGRVRTVSLRPDDVHSLVLWSKNYEAMLDNDRLNGLLSRYNVYFHFTITGLGGSEIEPRAPSTDVAVSHLAELCRRWGANRVNWRFDPIVHWRNSIGEVASNLGQFEPLSQQIASLGIRTCTFSFAQWYRKCITRASRRGFKYYDPDDEEKLRALEWMAGVAEKVGMELRSCASVTWTRVHGVTPAHCVDGELLSRLHPSREPAEIGKDKTQREECGCTPSIDIGSYAQVCPGKCVYCYASPC